MESGPSPPDRPQGDPGPQSPVPGTPPPQEAPPGGGPESPAPGPQSPPPSTGPQSPAYTGPVPPGGWYQPPPPTAGVVGGQLASWGSRLGAYFIDGLIIFVPALLVLSILGAGVVATGDDGDGGFVAFMGALLLTFVVIAVVALLYAPLLMSRQGQNNGQTWGKQMVGIRVVRDSGQPFTFAPAALREVVLKGLAVGIASSIVPILPWFLNFFWPLWDGENRALHDMAVSTHVVKA